MLTFKDIADSWNISEDELFQKLIDQENIGLGRASYCPPWTKETGEWLKTQYVQACVFENEGKVEDTPYGKCGKCGKLNLIYDDCGFFYTDVDGNYIPVCCITVHTAER